MQKIRSFGIYLMLCSLTAYAQTPVQKIEQMLDLITVIKTQAKLEELSAKEIDERTKIISEESKQSQALKQEQMKHLKIVTNIEKRKFEEIIPLATTLDTTQRIVDSFETCKSEHNLTHNLFIKHEIPNIFNAALGNLKIILTCMQNPTTPHAYILFLNNRAEFINHMNLAYTATFKPKFAGRLFNKFLVMKHKFISKEAGSNIPNLSESEAITVLTNLIILWEIYKNLCEKIDQAEEHMVKLNYFNLEASVENWISYTQNAGFTKKAEFSSSNLDELSPLSIALEKCLPKSTPSQPIQLSLPLRSIMSKIGTSLKNVAFVTGSSLKNAAYATGRSVKRSWNDFTRKIEEEADEL